MPPGTQPPMGVLNQVPSHKGAHITRLILMVVVVVILIVVFYVVWTMTSVSGSVSLIVRDVTGDRTLYTYSLSNKELVENESIDANLVVSSSAKLYQRSDGSVIGLTPAGVVMADIENRTTILIASPVSPTLQTPLAVWSGGERIAWQSPADGSVQVFERTERGTYVPIYLNSELAVSSLGFTEDGSVLVATKTIVERGGEPVTTDVFAIKLKSASVARISSLQGFATIVTP
ncbi:MAG: hypothetical protein AAB573_03485 [Patescibacteria group bacterium]